MMLNRVRGARGEQQGAGTMPYLEIKLGPDTLLVPFVGRVDYVVGRLPKADIQLRDMKVSRLHTQFFIDSRGRAFVRDLGSSGGTQFGNQRLPNGVIAPLTQGARVRVGDARFTFYDEQPPINAPNPPSKSDPRGLIRTNERIRSFAVEATVLAMDKVSAKTESGPAEAPPEINPADFSDEPLGPSGKQEAVAPAPAAKPAAPAPSKPAAAASPAAPAKPAAPAPAKPAAPAPAKPAAAPAAKPEANPRKKNTGIVEAPWDEREAGRSTTAKGEKRITIPPTGKAEPAGAAKPGAAPQQKGPSGPVAPAKPPARPADRDVPLATAAFQPPPQAPAKPAHEEEEERPRASMPTVRLDRAAVKRVEEPEEEAPRLPTVSAAAATPAGDEPEEPAPRIGLQPGEAPPKPPEKPAGEDDLTDEQIVEYMGGSVSGRWGPVSFGDGSGNSSSQEEPPVDEHAPTEEIALGPVAAKVSGGLDLDLDDESPAPAASAPEAGGADTPPPAMGRQGASTEGGFGPRKTRKLMKRRTEERSTDKTATPLPGIGRGAPTEVVPPVSDVRTGEPPLMGGAKTQFIPKPEGALLYRAPVADSSGPPEKATDKPKKMAENLDKKTVTDLGAGPGGDTVALPPDMMAALRADLAAAKGPVVEKPATIGESPTVKRPPEDVDREGDEADEFVLDDNYAFFTPPPATRKGKSPLPDTLDANDFAAEQEKLPPDRKATGPATGETRVE